MQTLTRTQTVANDLDRAADIVKAGGLVIVPTHSIYVLACDAFNPVATARLRAAKHSPSDKPLTIVLDKAAISNYAEVNARQAQIIDCIVPEMPVSMWLNKKDRRLDAAVADSEAVVMYFQETEIGELYRKCQQPLAISSANMAGGLPAATVQRAQELFGAQIDYYVSGGDNRGGEPTAHIDIREMPVRLKRAAVASPFSAVQTLLSEMVCSKIASVALLVQFQTTNFPN